MLEKFLELITNCWERLCFLEIVHVYEHAGVLRFGRYSRTLEPGLHWRWPIFEHVVSVITCTTTFRLPPQTLTTKDGVAIVVAAIVKYHIHDIKPYICDVWDQQDVLGDVTMGAVRITTSKLTWDELTATPPEAQVLDLLRKEVNKYGLRIEKFTFTDLGKVKSLRLMVPHPGNLAN